MIGKNIVLSREYQDYTGYAQGGKHLIGKWVCA